MLCGSCIRDNALARSLAGRGHDVHLVSAVPAQPHRRNERFGNPCAFRRDLGVPAARGPALRGASRTRPDPGFTGAARPRRAVFLVHRPDQTRTAHRHHAGGGPRPRPACGRGPRGVRPRCRPRRGGPPQLLLLGLAAPLAAAHRSPRRRDLLRGGPVPFTASLQRPRAGARPDAGRRGSRGSLCGRHRASRPRHGGHAGHSGGPGVLRAVGSGSRRISSGAERWAGPSAPGRKRAQ